MSQTPENQTNSSTDVVRKIFARDVKTGQTLHTVFKVSDKERHTAKSGKVFLSMTLMDKTGRLDGRIFDNVDAAEAAFANDDYLLVAGKIAVFHGKPQLVIERLEKLDPGPIDAKDFAYVAPEKPERPERPERPDRAGGRSARQRLLNLLDDPAIAGGLDALLKHLDRYIDERVEQRLSGAGPDKRTPRPPRHEAPRDEKKTPPPPAEPHKSGLPKDLAFKPFNALAGSEPESSGENSPPTPSAS